MTERPDDSGVIPGGLATRGTPIGERVEALGDALIAARGRVADDLLDEVAASVDRATGRLRLSARHTVVAIAGATGSGKSSTFNHLTGLELSSVGIRRPTTSWATAVVWGHEDAEELLSWLGIPPRHQTMRNSMLDSARAEGGFDGVVLLDLPDHDSTEVSHHLEVDRLVAVSDLMVWVLDPQKYADAAVHDRYFKPLATHQDVIVVALNHIDTVPEDQREALIADLRKLLAADGMPEVTILPISAKAGLGMAELRAEIENRVSGKRSTTARVEADVAAAAGRLAAAGGRTPAGSLPLTRIEELEAVVGDAAGIATVVDGLERSTGENARRAVAWPPLNLLRRRDEDELPHEPEVTPVDRATVATAVRGLGDEVGDGVGPAWAPAVRLAATNDLTALGDRLDRNLRAIDVGGRLPWWVQLLRVLQWLLLLVLAGGLVWWGLSALQGKSSDLPEVAGLALPVLVALAGLVAGLVLALIGRVMVGNVARERASSAEARLRGVVHDVLDAQVVQPVAREGASYAEFRKAMDAAQAR